MPTAAIARRRSESTAHTATPVRRTTRTDAPANAVAPFLRRKCEGCAQDSVEELEALRRSEDGTATAPASNTGSGVFVGAASSNVELEADAMATAALAGRSAAPVAAPSAVQRAAGGDAMAGELAPAQATELADLQRGGQPLAPAMREEMEQRFGADFSAVRLHTDAAAGQLAQQLHAEAFAARDHIAFGVVAGSYAQSPRGRDLLAHELAHVVQGQRSGGGASRGAELRVQRRPAFGRNTAEKRRPDAAAAAQREGDNTDAYGEVMAHSPWLLSVLTGEQIRIVQERLDLRRHNAKVQEQVEAATRRQRARDGSTYWALSSNNDEIARIERKYRTAKSQVIELTVDTAQLLSAEITAPQNRNIEAETRFRTELRQELVAKPTIIVFSPGEAPGFHLWWGRDVRLPSHGGIVNFADLLEIPRFGQRYERDVRNSPAIQAAREWQGELRQGVDSVMDVHRNRIDRNREHPIVRRIAEFLGGPDLFEIALLQARVAEHPDDTGARAKLADKLGVADASMPSFAQWDAIIALLDLAGEGIRDEFPEASGLALASAHDLALPLSERVLQYEEKVLGGAGAAVGVLRKLKTAGSIASTFLGGGLAGKAGYKLIGIAVASGGASGANTFAQGLAEGWGFGYGDGVKVAELAKLSAVDAVMTAFSTVVGGKFAAAIEGRLIARSLSPRMVSAISNAFGNAGASVFTAPANAVVRRLALNGKIPNSVDELVDLIVDEAVEQAITGALLGWTLSASSTAAEAPGGRPTPPGADIGLADTWPGSGSVKGDTLPGRHDTLPDVATADTLPGQTSKAPDIGTADTLPGRDTVPDLTTDTLPGSTGKQTLPGFGPTRAPIAGRRTLPGTGSGRPPAGGGSSSAGAGFNPRQVMPPGKWRTDGGRIYEKVGAEWLDRGPLASRPNFREVAFDRLMVRDGRLYEKRGGKWIDVGKYPTGIPPKFDPAKTIRGEVRLNAAEGRWEVNRDGTWHDIGPAPELPNWAKKK